MFSRIISNTIKHFNHPEITTITMYTFAGSVCGTFLYLSNRSKTQPSDYVPKTIITTMTLSSFSIAMYKIFRYIRT